MDRLPDTKHAKELKSIFANTTQLAKEVFYKFFDFIQELEKFHEGVYNYGRSPRCPYEEGTVIIPYTEYDGTEEATPQELLDKAIFVVLAEYFNDYFYHEKHVPKDDKSVVIDIPALRDLIVGKVFAEQVEFVKKNVIPYFYTAMFYSSLKEALNKNRCAGVIEFFSEKVGVPAGRVGEFLKEGDRYISDLEKEAYDSASSQSILVRNDKLMGKIAEMGSKYKAELAAWDKDNDILKEEYVYRKFLEAVKSSGVTSYEAMDKLLKEVIIEHRKEKLTARNEYMFNIMRESIRSGEFSGSCTKEEEELLIKRVEYVCSESKRESMSDLKMSAAYKKLVGSALPALYPKLIAMAEASKNKLLIEFFNKKAKTVVLVASRKEFTPATTWQARLAVTRPREVVVTGGAGAGAGAGSAEEDGISVTVTRRGDDGKRMRRGD